MKAPPCAESEHFTYKHAHLIVLAAIILVLVVGVVLTYFDMYFTVDGKSVCTSSGSSLRSPSEEPEHTTAQPTSTTPVPPKVSERTPTNTNHADSY